MPEYLNCATIQKDSDLYALLGHVDIDMLNSTLFPARLLSSSGSLHFRDPGEVHGEWKLLPSIGGQINITSQETLAYQASTTFLYFKSKDVNSYGVRILKFRKQSALPGGKTLNLSILDRFVFTYKILNKLCPENLCSMFQLRPYVSYYKY